MLEARRDELTEQFEAVTQRRGMLAQERLNAEARVRAGGEQDRAIVRELEQQVSELGQRSLRIQRELASTEDALAAAVSRAGPGVAIPTPAVAPRASFISVEPRMSNSALAGRYERMMLFEALGFLLVGAIALRLVWRAGLKRGAQAAPAAGLGQMQQALDVIAVEVERISENQRYVTKMLAEKPAEHVNVVPRKEGVKS